MRNIECDVLKCAVDLTPSTERSEGRELFGDSHNFQAGSTHSGNVRHDEWLGSMF